MIEIDMSEVADIAAELGAAGGKVEKAAGTVVQRTASGLEADARSSAPVRTGALRDSIHASGSGTEWSVEASAPHALFVEFGTYKDAPQPFLFPHADRAEAELEEGLTEIGDPFA